jgi:hypothetical protein
MPPASESRLLRSLGRVYDAMLRAYPSKFRHEYSREMALAFRERPRHVAQSHGTLALVPFVLHVVIDWGITVTRERFDMDFVQKVKLNRASTVGLIVFSATALAVVLPLWYGMLTGHVPPSEGDEGTAAHLFQVSIAALLPMGLVFLVTADWTQPVRAVRRMALPGIVVVLALGTVFYLENVYYAAHGYQPPRPGLPLILLRRILAAL